MNSSYRFSRTSKRRTDKIQQTIESIKQSAKTRTMIPPDQPMSMLDVFSKRSVISTLNKPVLLKEVDEDAWYELYDGNGGSYQERIDFSYNAYLLLSKKMERGVEVENILDAPSNYDEYDTEKADKFINMRMKNPVYKIGELIKTNGEIYKSKKSEKHQGIINKYKKYHHSIMVDFIKDDPFKIYQRVNMKIMIDKLSPHFLFNMGKTEIDEIPTWYGESEVKYKELNIFEKPSGKLYNYIIESGDGDIPFFLWNIFFQSLIALAQLHRIANVYIGNLTFNNFYYMYSSVFDGLPNDARSYNSADADELLYYEYIFLDDGKEASTFYTPALNINVILHNLQDGRIITSLDNVIQDYDTLFNLFIKKEDGGMFPDDVLNNNNKFSKILKKYKDSIIKKITDEKISPLMVGRVMIHYFAKRYGYNKIKGVDFSAQGDDINQYIINDEPFVI